MSLIESSPPSTPGNQILVERRRVDEMGSSLMDLAFPRRRHIGLILRDLGFRRFPMVRPDE